jgi:hypothetical protein
MKSKVLLAALAFFSASSLLLQSAEEVRLVQSNDVWRLLVGYSEASSPDITAWRSNSFDDAVFIDAPAPFTVGPYFGYGTPLPDPTNYSCVFLRHSFVITNVSQIAQLRFNVNYDDGLVVWINGVEVQRANVSGSGPVTYTNLAFADNAANVVPIDLFDPARYLVVGMNIIAVQVFNASTNSPDLIFDDGSLDAVYVEGPFILGITPAPGPVSDLTQITVQFSEDVIGVDAFDLLVAGVPATGVSGSGNIYTFTFPRPKPSGGTVHISWSATNLIHDAAMRFFDSGARGAQWDYIVPDIVAPTVTALYPPPGSTINPLRNVRVTFSEGVTNVEPADLLLNGKPATNVVRESASTYVFQFKPARPGFSQVAWAGGQGITDLASTPNAFAGGTAWNYFVDRVPYLLLVNSNQTNITVLFTNKFDAGVGTVEGQSGRLWVPLENFFMTNLGGQVTLRLPTNYTVFRLRTLSVVPGNAFANLAMAYGNIHTVGGLGETPEGVNGWLPSYENTPAVNVNLSNPRAAVADAAGNIYVVEKDGHAVDVIDTNGILHTIIGTHQPGTTALDDGTFEFTPTNSPLNKPSGLWFNPDLTRAEKNAGFLYVLDSGNNRVREYSTIGNYIRTLFTDSSGITNGGALWVSTPLADEAFYTDGTVLKHWQKDTGVEVLATGFLSVAGVVRSPQDRTIVADRGANRVYRVRGNGSYLQDVQAGTGFAKGFMSAGKAKRISIPGPSSICYLPIGGYFIGLEEGTRVWYVDANDEAAPFIFGASGVHDGDEAWFREHRRRPKVSNVHSVTLAPSGDIILVEGDGFVRKIDFLRHKP